MIDGPMGNFEQAFSTHGSAAVEDCHCGKTFFNPDGGWDWEPGELERLQASDATHLPYGVETIQAEGRRYVTDCDCWQERAKLLMAWIDGHGSRIAEYLLLEKERRWQEYEDAPIAPAAMTPGGVDAEKKRAPRRRLHLLPAPNRSKRP